MDGASEDPDRGVTVRSQRAVDLLQRRLPLLRRGLISRGDAPGKHGAKCALKTGGRSPLEIVDPLQGVGESLVRGTAGFVGPFGFIFFATAQNAVKSSGGPRVLVERVPERATAPPMTRTRKAPTTRPPPTRRRRRRRSARSRTRRSTPGLSTPAPDTLLPGGLKVSVQP